MAVEMHDLVQAMLLIFGTVSWNRYFSSLIFFGFEGWKFYVAPCLILSFKWFHLTYWFAENFGFERRDNPTKEILQ
jgi:predicted Na+-dependent transporter